MDENDFKRLLEESAAETHRRIDANAAETRERFAKMEARFDQIDARFDQVDARFDRVDARFAQVDARFAQVDARFAQVDARFEQVDARANDLKKHSDETVKQIRQDFHIVAEGMRADVQQVAESVLALNAKLDREAADIRAEMRQGFAETQSMLRFSHSQLDERITALERAAKR
jgi:chromosome segregation ATPase